MKTIESQIKALYKEYEALSTQPFKIKVAKDTTIIGEFQWNDTDSYEVVVHSVDTGNDLLEYLYDSNIDCIREFIYDCDEYEQVHIKLTNFIAKVNKFEVDNFKLIYHEVIPTFTDCGSIQKIIEILTTPPKDDTCQEIITIKGKNYKLIPVG